MKSEMRFIIFISRSLFLIMTGVILTVPSFTIQAEEKQKTISTTGVSIAGTDTSRKEAVRDALRNAVEEGMGTFITADLIVENKKIVDEKILSRTEGYVQDYRILEEEESGGLYKVKIEATVKTGEIQNELRAIGLLMERKQMPRVMILVGTREGGEYIYFKTHDWISTVKSIIEKAFLKKKFILVDYDIDKQRKMIELASGNVTKIAALAKHIGAEVLIIGESTRIFDRIARFYGTDARFYRTEVQLRVVEAGTGRVIFSGAEEGKTSATLNPLKESARKLTNEAIEALLQKWSSDVSNATTLSLSISGITFSQLIKLEKAISYIKGVEGLRRRSYAENEAHLDVEFAGNGDDLAERLLSITGPPIVITGLNQQTINLEVKP